MLSPDFDRAHTKAQEIHGARLRELIEFGIYDLVSQHFNYRQIEGTGMSIASQFDGESIVRVKVVRNKTGKEVLYTESVELTYDGETLSIEGAHHNFSGQIPIDKKERKTVIANALKNAFENPRRKVITDFNPRKFY